MIKQIITLIFVVLFTSIIVSAQTISDEELAGTLPTSRFYKISSFFDDLKVSLRFNSVDKEYARLDLANKRLLQYKIMLEKNNTQAAEVAYRNYEKVLSKLGTNIDKSNDNSKYIFSENIARHILVLEKVLNKTPTQAQTGLLNAINKSSQVFDKLQLKLPDNLKQNSTITRFKLKYMIITCSVGYELHEISNTCIRTKKARY